MRLPALKLPVVDAAKVAARRQLGRGLRLGFDVAGTPGELRLEPGPASAGKGLLSMETACGVLTFTEPGPVLSLLGKYPVVLAEAGNDPHSWFWALFQDGLSPQLVALFGFLRPLEQARNIAFGCRLTVVLGESRAVARLTLSPASLMALIDAARWVPVSRALPDAFRLNIQVPLGSVRLSFSQVAGLRRGDLLLLESARFTPSGEGHVDLGRKRLRGCIDDKTGALRLTLLAIEDTPLDDELEMLAHGQTWDGQVLDQTPVDALGHELFDELAMTLTVRCGNLQLTLGELRALVPGTVLGVSGYGPGMAGLYYGDRPLGRGQLVDVDGRLGLQLTHVIFAR